MKYNIKSLNVTCEIVKRVCKEYTEDKMSIMNIAIKNSLGYHIVRQMLKDNSIELREGNKKIN